VNCLDCQDSSTDAPAVGVCHQCGAGVCAEHAVIKWQRLSCVRAVARVVVIDRPVRRVLCQACARAHHERAKCCPQTAGTLPAS
jgi:hypothetical protein